MLQAGSRKQVRRGQSQKLSQQHLNSHRSREEEARVTPTSDPVRWVNAVSINLDEQDWYCRRLGEGVDFCSGQVKSEMASDIQMEKSGRRRGRNV